MCRSGGLHTVCLLVCVISAVFTVVQGAQQCWECMSKSNGIVNPLCPVNGSVDPRAYSGPCSGLCFTRTHETDPSLIYRGCTASQWGLPTPLPTDGCYRWHARSQLWCLCDTDNCNGVQMGQAGNMTLEEYAQDDGHKPSLGGNSSHSNDTLLPPSFSGVPGVLQCWQCFSYYQGQDYPQCPLHGQVDVNRAYIGNCTGHCFMSSSVDTSSIEVMHRGCTSDQWGLPDPLPSEGCYTRTDRAEVWCLCSTDGCNGIKIGQPKNMTLEEYAEGERNKDTGGGDSHSTDSILPPSLAGQNTSVLQCWECQSYLNGQQYSQCPLDQQVDIHRAYIGDCTGRCYMHNSLDTADLIEVMYRGCTSSQWGLPDPLPPDGCYTWYHEIWCICSVNGCNGFTLGVPSREFDAHVSNRGHLLHANGTPFSRHHHGLCDSCLLILFSSGVYFLLSCAGPRI